MAFFAEKVRRKLKGNFTFLLMTDRNDLDSQIYKTFIGCGVADDQTARATSGDDLEKRLKENRRYVFSLIHKFNKDLDPSSPIASGTTSLSFWTRRTVLKQDSSRATCASHCRMLPS